jgi:tRNA A64-2'-O-ribosylphosphate transferase
LPLRCQRGCGQTVAGSPSDWLLDIEFSTPSTSPGSRSCSAFVLPMPPPTAISHEKLIFPTAHNSINTTLAALKRSNLSITNRLRSIANDAELVQAVQNVYQLPLIANERCGSWYIPPSFKAGSAYFKSTDGHHGQWSFSLRRLNVQVLKVIGDSGG